MKNLWVRTVSGAVLAVVMLGAIAWSQWSFGLLLAAFSLGHPRDVPETNRDSAPWPVVRVVPAWNGLQAEKTVY